MGIVAHFLVSESEHPQLFQIWPCSESSTIVHDTITKGRNWTFLFLSDYESAWGSESTPSEPRLSPAATMSDDMLSANTPLLHCTSILQPASPRIVSCESYYCSNLSQPRAIVTPFDSFWFTETRFLNLCVCFCLSYLCFSVGNKVHIWLFVCSLVVITTSIPLLPRPLCSFWHYQKYGTILTLSLCILSVTPLICSSYSSFAPPSPFFSSWWRRDWKSSTDTFDLWGSPSTSSRQPPTTYVFADSRIRLLCHALHICIVHVPPESCSFFLLVYWAFRACYWNRLPLLHHTSLQQNQSFKRPFQGSRFERLDDAVVLLISLIFLYPPKIDISGRSPFKLWMNNVCWNSAETLDPACYSVYQEW